MLVMATHQRLRSYSYSPTKQLHVISFSSNSSLTHSINSFKFEAESSWCEVPGSLLFFTGGPSSFTLDVLREFAISNKPPMLCARRRSHSSVCHHPYLYVIGGHDGTQWMEACERYSFQDNQWKVLPPLPTACYYSSAIVVEDAVYVLGGLGGVCKEYLNVIQKLCLKGLSWEVCSEATSDCLRYSMLQDQPRLPSSLLRTGEQTLLLPTSCRESA
jgi:hypothetical protein